MDDFELDNPFWSSLRTRHRDFARRLGDVARYPADVAPFLGVADADSDVGAALESLVPADDTVLLLGVAPRVPDGWRLEAFADLAQMVCTGPVDVIDGPDPIELTDAHRADALGLVERSDDFSRQRHFL